MEYTLMVLKYNNYYDRLLKREKTLAGYEAADGYIYYETGVYFPFGNNVDTVIQVNGNVEEKDYVVLLNENNEIVSRWFIIDKYYELNGQQTLSLRRDLLADFYKEALHSTAFVEKGYLKPESDLLFNKEDMTFNQVKKDELLLKDNTKIPWIVGYYANNADIKGTAEIGYDYDVYVDCNFSEWKYYNAFRDGYFNFSPKNQKYCLYNNGGGTSGSLNTTLTDTDAGISVETRYVKEIPLNIFPAFSDPVLTATQFQQKVGTTLTDNYYEYNYLLYEELGFSEDITGIVNFNNKRIKFKDGIKNISVTKSGVGKGSYIAVSGKELETKFISDISYTGIEISPQVGKSWIKVDYDYDIYTCSYHSERSGSYTYSIGEKHYTLNDAPYSMFCMPYGFFTVTEGTKNTITDKDINIAVATDIAQSSGNVYDIQILPYCPVSEINSSNYTVDSSKPESYDAIKSGEITVGYIFHCQRSSFSKIIDIPPRQWLVKKTKPVDVKVQNECEFIRLNSPNYASSWEMSVAKNKGISVINVVATYKPFNPYIKVYPDFKGLYGSDFNDNRGLILSGDFSIPIITDQWKTYELQNKNYQNMFDREIQNLEVQQKYVRLQDIVGIVTGAIGAAGTGAALGGAGGPVGMGVGAALGGLASTGAGIADLAINDKLRDEARGYKTDMYGYQLGNIKALPHTLTKTSAYNIDNKYFPFIEHYSATPVEIVAFENKLEYNGMTVGVIGKAADYIKWGEDKYTYVKAKLIRLYSIDDMHISNQIAAEMEKGVYVNGNIAEGT